VKQAGQRELQSEGTSFERLLDAERRRRARDLILRGMPMKSIACFSASQIPARSCAPDDVGNATRRTRERTALTSFGF
jgi:hypothetical protein